MSSPLVTLLLLVLGLGAGVLLVGGMIYPRSWAVAAALLGVTVLGVFLPVRLRDSGRVLQAQRASSAGVYEDEARERCLQDMGRADLVESLAFAREQIPEDARFALTTHSPSLACFTLNLLPREPVRSDDFDPARDWRILDRAPPGRVDPPATGEVVAHSPSFVLVRPEAAVAE
jgi:hypothetical protein